MVTTVYRQRKANTGDQELNEWLHQEIRNRGLEAHLDNPEFNFLGYLRGKIAKAGLPDQDDAVQEIFTRLAWQAGSGGEGNLWAGYAKQMEKYEEPLPIDKFFQLISKQKVASFIRDTQTERRHLPTTRITPSNRGEEGGTGGISEETLPGEYQSEEQSMEMSELLGGFRDHLSRQRNADRILQVYDGLVQGYSQKEMADQTGMSTGQVNNWKNAIVSHLGEYAQSSDNQELGYFLQKMQEKLTTPDKPKQNRFQYFDPNQGKLIDVEVVRRGKFSWRVKGPGLQQQGLPEGFAKVSPDELSPIKS